jgi:hypothetical protein
VAPVPDAGDSATAHWRRGTLSNEFHVRAICYTSVENAQRYIRQARLDTLRTCREKILREGLGRTLLNSVEARIQRLNRKARRQAMRRFLGRLDARLTKTAVILDHETGRPLRRGNRLVRVDVFKPLRLHVGRDELEVNEITLHLLAFTRAISDAYTHVALQGIIAFGWRRRGITLELSPGHRSYFIWIGWPFIELGSDLQSWRYQLTIDAAAPS